MTQQEFDKWKSCNKHLVSAWETRALIYLHEGKKHLRAAAITEWVRDHTPYTGERYKIPNDCNTWLSRYFIWLYPNHSDKFTLTKKFRYTSKG